MAQVLTLPAPGSSGKPQPPACARKKHGTSTTSQPIRDSVSRMFYERRRSVRKIHGIYRQHRVSERMVEDIIREHFRAELSRAMSTGWVRRAA